MTKKITSSKYQKITTITCKNLETEIFLHTGEFVVFTGLSIIFSM